MHAAGQMTESASKTNSPPDAPAHPDAPVFEDWGITDYGVALERQLMLVESRKRDAIPDTVVFTEHNPVYTVGVRRDAVQHLVWDRSTLEKQGIQLFETRRGGDITFHGPGQVVGYPIIRLRPGRRDLHAYLRSLEDGVAKALTHWGLEAGRREGMTGVWLGKRKICAIGVGVKSWVTYHGFALNVNTDLAYFQGIIPCGITDGTVTSIAKESGKEIDTEEVKEILRGVFRKIFHYELPSSARYYDTKQG